MTSILSSMGLFEHLSEMRQRLFRAVVAWILATVVAMAFSVWALKAGVEMAVRNEVPEITEVIDVNTP